MIRAYTGRLGSYKTASMVWDAKDDFKDSLRQVYTCMKSLRIPGAVYFDLENMQEICQLSTGLVLLDEAQLGLGSRSWSKTPESVLSALAQLRKNGLDLYLTTQHLDRVDTVLRVLVSEVVACQKVGGFILQRASDPNLRDAKDRKKPLRTRLRWFDRTIWALYDTYEILGTQLDRGLGRAEWLDACRQAREAKRGRGRRAADPWSVPPVYLYDGGRGQRLSREAIEAREDMTALGYIDESRADWWFWVQREVRRRRWLKVFGLKAAEVPYTVTVEHPWAEGCCPCCRGGVGLARVDLPPALRRVVEFGTIGGAKDVTVMDVVGGRSGGRVLWPGSNGAAPKARAGR